MQKSTDGRLGAARRRWRSFFVGRSDPEIDFMEVEVEAGGKLPWIGKNENAKEDSTGSPSKHTHGRSRRSFVQGISQRRIRAKWLPSNDQESRGFGEISYEQSRAAAEKLREENLKKQLLNAVEKGDCPLVKSLSLNGASLEWTNAEGMTPLMVSCTREDLFSMALTLIKLGCLPTSSAGRYALHHAASSGLINTVALLLSCGADSLVANDEGQTPLDIAREKKHIAVVRIIEDWVCYFGGYLRELYNSKSSKKLVSKKVWAVVLPTCSTENGAPARNELALYASRKGNSPTRVVWLGSFTSEIREPNMDAADPHLVILDKVTKQELRFRAEMRGDKDQVKRLHVACTQGGEAQMSVYHNIAGVRSADDISLEIAMETSIQTALQEGMPLSKMVSLDLKKKKMVL
ncbi:hypothetical protein SELMODRAFT_405610 [Selaginella moellendorffii]|uniref:Uncharacterized protein n=1 Tax=Selaginella moellendorffii TaxID=88036 RepID=D8QZ49_SELML|nr:probable E3 ubiquitin-protein ligase XBOS34 [Selaginella moellendorffii]EFJ34354.1 hypothetical protein SELMODRAFT_405610 [Selaginella moellendorffii]|eukprot:XP_002964021.1 probable E3 ubiquitin-protein ligase XBOS34 [Selaginella moellendorffii]